MVAKWKTIPFYDIFSGLPVIQELCK